MGLSTSTANAQDSNIVPQATYEEPSPDHDATLYYFGGRGLADQIRWMLAASDVSFTQKEISTREQFVKLAARQLPFGQLPLLQIDGLEIVQSQAAVRYLARRANPPMIGKTNEEILKCDMIAESVRDLLGFVTSMPFKRVAAQEAASTHSDATTKPAKVIEYEELKLKMKEKFQYYGQRFELVLKSNNKAAIDEILKINKESKTNKNVNADELISNIKIYLVGDSMTYADVLVAHITTWFIEEAGAEVVKDMPLVVHLQNQIISLPGVKKFITSNNFYRIGDANYTKQVSFYVYLLYSNIVLFVFIYLGECRFGSSDKLIILHGHYM